MLFKLSLRNARRQASNYLVYFITITLTAALIHAFNGLVASREIKTLSTMMESLPMTIVLASIVVVGILAWLVHYTMRFMLTKRSHELGTYILMGLENKQVAQLFFVENLVVGGVALVVGILSGNLIFQCLRAITLKLFQVPYTFSFSFSLKAIGLTFVYFMLIYAFALLKSRKRIRNMKIYGLLYLDRQNETEAVKKRKTRRLLSALSVICGVIGIVLLIAGNLALGITGAAFVIFALYGFFINFSSGVPAYFEKHPAKKYKNTNLLVFRSLGAKMTTMGITMATIAVLFTATLISEGSGLLFANQFERNAVLYSNFDLFISSSFKQADFTDYKEYIQSNIPIREEYEYEIYFADNDDVMQYIIGSGLGYWSEYEKDTLMRMSDYVILREMSGYPEVSIEPDGYIIHCMDYLGGMMEEYNNPLTVGENTLSKCGLYTENFTQYFWDGNGDEFILVVPDEVTQGQARANQSYAAMSDVPVAGEMYQGLEAIRDEKASMDMAYDTMHSPAAIREDNASMYAIIIFPLFYLALVLTMAAATILTVQLLSDVNRYRNQFELLRKLGQSRKDMVQALSRQFILFYAMPALPALFISITFLIALGGAFDPGIILGKIHLFSIIGTAVVLFFVIYLVYIMASYTSFKRNVLPEE